MENTPKVTYWACWWRATWVLFVAYCVLGFLAAGSEGLARAMGGGLVIAPFSGLFWGWIYWLIKK